MTRVSERWSVFACEAARVCGVRRGEGRGCDFLRMRAMISASLLTLCIFVREWRAYALQ